MLKRLVATVAAALLCMAAAPAKPPVKPAPKAAAKSAKTSAGFDARDPAAMIALLATVQAKAEVGRREEDSVFLTVTSASVNFSAQFAGCTTQGKGCQAVLFDQPGALGAPTMAQVNAFNQTSVMCRVYQDKAGKPHVEYSALLFPRNSREEMLMHLNAWRGCMADFAAFAKDPTGFLASAA